MSGRVQTVRSMKANLVRDEIKNLTAVLRAETAISCAGSGC